MQEGFNDRNTSRPELNHFKTKGEHFYSSLKAEPKEETYADRYTRKEINRKDQGTQQKRDESSALEKLKKIGELN